MSEIKVGQVFEDADPRAAGRTVEVMAVEESHALVRLNTTARNVSKGSIGRRTRIRLDRLRSSDYALSTVPPHRFGKLKFTGEVGYWPIDDIG